MPIRDNLWGAPPTRRVSGKDTFRIKAFNSWPQAEQVNTANVLGSVAGPENMQFKSVIKFVRASDPDTELTCTKIVTMDNDRGVATYASAGLLSCPFGAAAAKGRTVTDANCTANNKTIDQNTLANPTVVRTTAGHTLTTGDMVVISGSNSTPSIDGIWYVTVTDATHFTIPVNVSIAGTAGSLFASRTLTSATANFTTADVGKNITLSIGGTTGLADGSFGSGGPYGGQTPLAPCQGPKFPARAGNVTYDGIIMGFTNSTTVTVKPSLTSSPGGTGVLKIEPALLADSDGLELGDGWLTGVDINYWQGDYKPGQSMMECEINRNIWNGHEGITLIPKSYLEPSGHLSWPTGRPGPSNSVTGHGFTRSVAIANPAAATNFTATCPGNCHWKLNSVTFALTTDATVANRIIQLIVDDGITPNVVWNAVAGASQTATQTAVYAIGPGVNPRNFTPATGAIRFYIELPIGIEMSAGWRVRTAISNITGADQLSAIVLGVEEWIEQ